MEYIALLNPPLVRINNPVRVIVTGLLIAVTVVLPALVHTLGLNGAVLLPMHWTVLLCGLVFGPVGGFIAGASSPMISFMLSGLPKLPILLPMTLELAAYGMFAGLFRKFKLDTIVSTLLAMIAGRLVYTLAMLNAESCWISTKILGKKLCSGACFCTYHVGCSACRDIPAQQIIS